MDRRWLLGGLLIAGGIGLAAAATKRPKITEKSRVLLFGDSMAAGLMPHMKRLSEEAGVEAYAGKGVQGTRLDQWDDDAWLDATLKTFEPTLILVALGTNDEALQYDGLKRQAPHLAALLEKLAATGAEIVWIGPPAVPFEKNGISELIRENVPYYFDSEVFDIPRSPDGLHPTAAGYSGWAGLVWQWLS